MKNQVVLTLSLCFLVWLFSDKEILAQQMIMPPDQSFVLRFSGLGIAIAPQGANLNLGLSFTIETWLFLEDSVAGRMILGRAIDPRGGDPRTNYTIETGGNGKQIAFIQSTGLPGSSRTILASGALKLRTWYHVAATLGNGEMKLFINGTEAGSQLSAGAPKIDAVHFAVGGGACNGCTSGGGLIGAMREARVWNRTLNATELSTNSSVVLTGSEVSLAAYWRLDEGSGQIAHDSGPNKYDLQLGSDPLIDQNDPQWKRPSILEQDPHFSFKKFSTTSQATGLNYFTLIDFDNDNDLDVIGTQADANFLPVPLVALKNDGLGNFSDNTANVLGPNITQTIAVTSLIVRDFNKDNRSDLFIADIGVDKPPYSGTQSQLLTQSTDKKLINVTNLSLPAKNGFVHFASSADIDNDGDSDIFYGNVSAPRLYINDGSGRFLADSLKLPEDITRRTSPSIAYTASCFLDSDKDGDMDLILGAAQSQNVARYVLLLNDGTGKYSHGSDLSMPLRYGSPNWYSVSIAPLDANGDGWTDFIATANSDDFTKTGVQLALSNKDGTFRDATYQLPSQGWPPNGGFRFITPTDINGDGLVDLVSSADLIGIPIFLNSGNAMFANATEFLPANTSAARMGLPGDLNRDGRMDLSFINGSSEFMVLQNLKNLAIGDLTLPLIESIIPNTGSSGDTIRISGKNLLEITEVHFSQTSSNFLIKSDTLILALVPTGASSGIITFTSSLGSVASNNAFFIAKANQTITFTIPDKTLGAGLLTLTATASSGLPVTYSTTTPSKVNINGNQVILAAAGKATIKASQVGDASFNAAPEVSRTFCINPPKPTIAITNINTEAPTLTSSAAVGNQWYKDGAVITGATNSTISVTTAGIYAVKSTVETCISDMSNDFPIIITGDLGRLSSNQLMLIPNPTDNFLIIHLPDEGQKDVNIFQLNGRLVENKNTEQSSIQIDLSGYSSSYYLVRVSTKKGLYYGKFIKK